MAANTSYLRDKIEVSEQRHVDYSNNRHGFDPGLNADAEEKGIPQLFSLKNIQA